MVAIAIAPSETKRKRNAPMTDREFDVEMATIRRKLDAGDQMPADAHWRGQHLADDLREQMAEQRLMGWTYGQIARFHSVDRAVVEGVLRPIERGEVA